MTLSPFFTITCTKTPELIALYKIAIHGRPGSRPRNRGFTASRPSVPTHPIRVSMDRRDNWKSRGPKGTILSTSMGRSVLRGTSAILSIQTALPSSGEVQRLFFWSCVLSGACGHTYGANGLWQINRTGQPHGDSPHGGNYGDVTWEDAMNLPGSGQLGIAKKILEAYRWWEFVPHQEWIYETPDSDPRTQAFAAGIPGEVRFVYGREEFWASSPSIRELQPGAKYTALFIDPVSGKEHPAELADSYSPPARGDWLLIMLNDMSGSQRGAGDGSTMR